MRIVQFEAWGTGFNGIPSVAGGQFIELNVEGPDRIFQTMCLTAGDRLRFSPSRIGGSPRPTS